MVIPISAGKVICSRNGEDFIPLFDGRQENRVPRGALKYLRQVARTQHTDLVQIQHNCKNKFDDLVKSQECRHSCESRGPEVFEWLDFRFRNHTEFGAEKVFLDAPNVNPG